MRKQPAFFLSAEQRTGKSRPIIEEVAELYRAGEIDAFLIIAMPSGAPRNWVDDEIPLWLDADIPRTSFIWRATKIKQLRSQDALKSLFTSPGLSILAVNGESVITEAFKSFIKGFVAKRRVYAVVDESTLVMKTPGAKRTKVIHWLRTRTKYRRCLDGTPTGEGPMDLYSQYYFLDPAIIGFSSFFAFRAHYAVLEKARNWSTGFDYTTIKKDEDTGEPTYQNLDDLQARIAPFTFRVLRKDVFKDTPQPIFQKHYFNLAPAQRKAYDELKTEYETELRHIGTVTAEHVLTRYLRLQQVASGYWPAQRNQPSICPKCLGEGCETCQDLGVKLITTPLTRIVSFADNPRLQALREELELTKGSVIIWARFDQDIDDCMMLTGNMGLSPVQYDGRVNEEQKAAAKDLFQRGLSQCFVAKTRAAGRAIRLDKADTMIYYSNEFSLLQRLQSQDRTETAERRTPTGIVDLVAEDTLDDEVLIPALRAKKKITDQLLQERTGKWL